MTLNNKAWLLVKCLASVRKTDDRFVDFLVSQSRTLLDERRNSEADMSASVTRRDVFRQIWN